MSDRSTAPRGSTILLEVVIGGGLLYKANLLRAGGLRTALEVTPVGLWCIVVAMGVLGIWIVSSSGKRMLKSLAQTPAPSWALRIKAGGLLLLITSSFTGAALAYLLFRIYLARVIAGLVGDLAVMTLLADPLWRLEFGICNLIGDGSLAFLNRLAIGLWASLAVLGVGMTARNLRRVAG
jgi:hypothetical protein